MSEGVSDLELRRALWRHRYGHMSESRLSAMLRDELAHAAGDFGALEPHVPLVARHHPKLLTEYHDFRARGHRALQVMRFGEAAEQILRGRRTLADIRQLAAAHADLEKAGAAARWLEGCAPVARLRALPSIRVPERLAAIAAERFAAGRFRAAGALGRVCVAQVRPLAAREPSGTPRLEALRTAIAALRDTCTATAALLDEPARDLPADGTLACVLRLAEAGYLALAERLSAELELAVAAREQLRRELTRGAGDPVAAPGALREAMRDVPEHERWTAAARRLWRERLDAAASASASVHPDQTLASPAIAP